MQKSFKLLFILFICCLQSIAQNQRVIDSLLQIVESDLYNKISSDNYIKNNDKQSYSHLINNDLYQRRAIQLADTGNIYDKFGDYIKALEYHFKCMEIHKFSGNKKGIAKCLNDIGIIYGKQGDYEKALDYYFNSLKIGRRINNVSNLSIILGNGEVAYEDSVNYRKTLNMLNKSLNVSDSTRIKASKSHLLFALGSINKQLNKFSKAKFFLREALKAAQNTNHKTNIRNIAEQLALVEKFLGNYEASYKAYVLYKQMADSIHKEETIEQIAHLKAGYEFQQEKNPIQFANQSQNLFFESEIEKQKIIQNITYIGLGLIGMLILVIFSYFYSRHQSMAQFSTLNKKIQAQNIKIQAQKDLLEETLQTLKQAQIELIQQEKMTSLKVLSAGVAHEINNPLNFIQQGEQLIKERFSPFLQEDSRLHEIFKATEEGIRRIKNVVESLRGYSHNEDGNYEYCNIQTIVENCLNLLRNRIFGKIKIVVHFDENALEVYGNPGKLYQAFFNILHNAVQAIESEGTISIRTESYLNNLQFSIRDTGKGIPEEYKQKLGDPFFTTKNPGEGIGLGLFFTFDILRNHNATYKIISKEGQGTEVRLTFPMHAARQALA